MAIKTKKTMDGNQAAAHTAYFFTEVAALQYSIPFMLIQNVYCQYNPKGTHD